MLVWYQLALGVCSDHTMGLGIIVSPVVLVNGWRKYNQVQYNTHVR